MADVNLKIPAIDSLVKHVASGIGAVAGPMLEPWKARQETKAKLIRAEAEADRLKLFANAQAEACRLLLPQDEEAHGVLDIGGPNGISQRIEFQERKRQANIASVVRDAAAVLDGKEVDDHEPDPDWTARFFNSVQDVTSEDMRKIWARILAGEVEGPSRTSLRTLDVLRNMTTKDAKMFERICRYVVRDPSKDKFFFSDEEHDFGHLAIPFEDLIYLQEIGLINANNPLEWSVSLSKQNKTVLFFHEKFLIILTGSKSKDSQTIKIPIYRLTNPGKELHAIAGCEFHWDYLQPLARFLRTQDIEVSCAQIIESFPDGNYGYSAPFDPFKIESAKPRGTVS